MRIKGERAKRAGYDQNILYPYGGFISVTYIKIDLRHFCHFLTGSRGHIASETRGKLMLINP
jgi:hypothetical protein